MLTGFLVTSGGPDRAGGRDCPRGTLRLYGSTAFSPSAAEIGTGYHKACPGAAVDVRARGSVEAVRQLVRAGSAKAGGAADLIAMSDGLADDGDSRLRPHPVAVVMFSVVVNKGTGSTICRASSCGGPTPARTPTGSRSAGRTCRSGS